MLFLISYVFSSSEFVIVQNKARTRAHAQNPKTKQLRHLHVVVYKNGALPFLSRLPLLKDG